MSEALANHEIITHKQLIVFMMTRKNIFKFIGLTIIFKKLNKKSSKPIFLIFWLNVYPLESKAAVLFIDIKFLFT